MAEEAGDKKLSRSLRADAISGLENLNKVAQNVQTGVFRTFRDGVAEYNTRENMMAERGGEVIKEEDKYNLSIEHKDADFSHEADSHPLSTRYSPEHPGVMTRRLTDGEYLDPITNKVFSYREGFTTSDGRTFPGGDVSLQTDIIYK